MLDGILCFERLVLRTDRWFQVCTVKKVLGVCQLMYCDSGEQERYSMVLMEFNTAPVTSFELVPFHFFQKSHHEFLRRKIEEVDDNRFHIFSISVFQIVIERP